MRPADLQGVYVLPAHRRLAVGTALMLATLSSVEKRSPRLIVEETMSFLDADMPSLHLYRKSGGQVQAEYLHLQPR